MGKTTYEVGKTDIKPQIFADELDLIRVIGEICGFISYEITAPGLSYHAAISMTSFSASGRERTCQVILLFEIGGALLVFPGTKMMWDLSGGLPNVIPAESHQPLTMVDHPAQSLGE